MAFQQYTADDRSPGALSARKFWTDLNTVKPAEPGAEAKKKSPFDLISVSKNPELDSLLSNTVKEGLAQKTDGVPSGGESFAALRGIADADRAEGRLIQDDFAKELARIRANTTSAIDKANRDSLDQSSRFLETYGLGRNAASGANLGVGTELARVAGQAASTARNPALLALANLDADLSYRQNAARQANLGRDFSLQSNLANFGRDVLLDPQRQLSAKLSNLGAANAIERSLRFENVGGMFDVPGATSPRFGSSAYIPPVRGYNNPAVSRVAPPTQAPPTQAPPSGGGRQRSAAEIAYERNFGSYPDQDPGWSTSEDRRNFYVASGGRVGSVVPPRQMSWTSGTLGTWDVPTPVSSLPVETLGPPYVPQPDYGTILGAPGYNFDADLRNGLRNDWRLGNDEYRRTGTNPEYWEGYNYPVSPGTYPDER